MLTNLHKAMILAGVAIICQTPVFQTSWLFLKAITYMKDVWGYLHFTNWETEESRGK